MQSAGIHCFTCLECLYPAQPLLHGLLTSLQVLHTFCPLVWLILFHPYDLLFNEASWSPFPKRSHFLLLKCLSPFGFGFSILLICLFLLCSLPFSFALLLPNLKIPSASGSILRLLLFLIHAISAESSCTLFNSRPDSLLQMPSQPHHRLNMYLQAKLPWDTDPFIAPLHAQHLHLDVSHPLKFNIFETELLIFS